MLVDQSGADRDMVLTEEFWYVDPNSRRWQAPFGARINGASIPRPLWSMVGSPYTDDYRRASIVHDVACINVEVNRKDADVMFYNACLAGGCPTFQAMLLYAGVCLGRWSSVVFPSRAFSKEKLLFRVPFQPSLDEQFLQNKFLVIASELMTQFEGASEVSYVELDVVISKHINL